MAFVRAYSLLSKASSTMGVTFPQSYSPLLAGVLPRSMPKYAAISAAYAHVPVDGMNQTLNKPFNGSR